ncbi:hypothetical protein Enr17x_03690 [Gimesia fumaroli]|uniref:Uncharacterized protein n=1 Tax=Gimesia fumaroli TaxID=2527976 RepID=A0A518I5K1_9PLAN|nr:hypothetical protein Enr17x_03690 [Gimesia fumaroli]
MIVYVPEHGVNPCAQACFHRQVQEEIEGFVSNAILQIVETDAQCLGHHPLAVCGIFGEKLPKM